LNLAILPYGDATASPVRYANSTGASRRQEVMKAVMLNSADKVQDTGDGRRLKMKRRIIDKQNQDWLASLMPTAIQKSRYTHKWVRVS